MDIETAFKHAAAKLEVGPVKAEYYPYSELKHTWVRIGRTARFRISDYMEGSPDAVLESLGEYLVRRAFARPCGKELMAPYVAYAGSRQLWESARARYIERAKNLSFGARGEARDLKIVFDYVNSYYFSGKAPEPVLAWVSESPRRRLGYYFEPLKILAANKALDSDTVPRYVLEFVMYHELLHHLRAGDGKALRRVHHTSDFRRQERQFTHYEDAEAWLMKIASRRR